MGATNDVVRAGANRLMQAGFTQKQLAAALEVSESKVSRWLNGEGPPLTMDQFDRYQAYIRGLGALLDELRGRPPSEQPAAASRKAAAR